MGEVQDLSRNANPHPARSTLSMDYFSEDPEVLSKSDVFAWEIDLTWMDLELPEWVSDKVSPLLGKCGDDDDAFTLYFLSKTEPPFGLWATLHGHIKNGKLALLKINIDRKPKGDPPEDYKKTSERFGGFPEGLNDFVLAFAGAKGTCEGMLRLVFKKSPFSLEARKCSEEIVPFKLESETITFKEPEGTTVEIAFLSNEGAMVKTEWAFELAIKEGYVESAAQILRGKLAPLLRKL